MRRRSFLGCLGAAAVLGPTSAFAWTKSPTRARLVASLASGLIPEKGQSYTADGFQYVGEPGASSIPDMPGLLPAGECFPQHFGAKANLIEELRHDLPDYAAANGRRSGFVMRSGSNDRDAFLLADAYASSIGGKVSLRGKYFIDGETWRSAAWEAERDFEPVIWVKFYWDPTEMELPQSGLRSLRDGASIRGIKIIGQYVSRARKPSGNGNLGNIISDGLYYTFEAQRVIRGIRHRVMLCRAGHIPESDQISSNGSFGLSMMGGHEDCSIEIGTWGKTNVASAAPLMFHWGAFADQKTVGFDTSSKDRTSADVIESYHTVDWNVTWLNEPDNADGHEFSRNFALVSVGPGYMGDLTSRGVPSVGWITCGDVVDAFTTPSQKGLVGQGIRGGQLTALDCKLTDSGDEGRGFFVSGRGESKGHSDRYDGTNIFVSRQLPWDIKLKGVHIECAGSSPGSRGIWINGCLGQIDLGKISTFGVNRGVEVEHSNCDIQYDYVSGDGVLMYEFSKGGRILGSSTKRRDRKNAEEGEAQSRKSAAAVVGRMLSTVTTSNLQRGETIIPIQPFDSGRKGTSNDVYIGDPVRIGDETVEARALIQNGAPYLITTPLASHIPAGTPVIIDQRACLKQFIGTFDTQGEGLIMVEADVLKADLSHVEYAGSHIARLKRNSFLQLVSPPHVTTDDKVKTIAVDKSSRFKFVGAL